MSGKLIGIDPGKYGAAAVFDHGTITVIDFPLKIVGTKTVKGKKQKIYDFDPATLFQELIPYQGAIAVIEDVSSFGMGKQSAFNFGRNVGLWLGVLAALNIEVRKIQPAAWKQDLGLNSDKDLSMTEAARLYPQTARLLTRKKDNDRAEAILLAHWLKIHQA